MRLDLINQARSLATLDARGAPKQANLRRAVSSAYYALFHFLVDEACRAIIGTQHAQQGYRYALARAFVRTTMKKACGSFDSCQLPDAVQKPLPKDANGKYLVPMPIQNISATFRELQTKRHLADYDLADRCKRFEVLSLVEEVERCISDFTTLARSDDPQFFLVSLLTWNELTKR